MTGGRPSLYPGSIPDSLTLVDDTPLVIRDKSVARSYVRHHER
jgi:hypothetical protein